MDVEDLLAAAEIADDVEQFGARIGQVFRHCALAEIEAVPGAFIHGDEALHAVDGAQHVGDALIAFRRRARILRVAGDAHLVFIGHRHDALQEVVDAFPESVGADNAGLGQRRVLGQRLLGIPAVMQRVAASRHAVGAHHAQHAHIVLDGPDAGGGAGADMVLEGFDIAVALRALAQHDGRVLFPVDVRGGQQHAVHHADIQLPFGGQLQHLAHLFRRRIEAGGVGYHRAGADLIHAVTRHPGGAAFGQGAELVAQLGLQRRQLAAGAGTGALAPLLLLRLGGRNAARRDGGGAGAGDGKEFSAIH